MGMLWLQLMFLCASVHQVTSTGAGRHSLWVFASYISGPKQFSDFSVVLMLDDLQVGYYEEHMDHLRSSSKGARVDVAPRTVGVLQAIYHGMRNQMTQFRYLFNLTKGIHVQQKIAGCEVEDGQPTFMMVRDGFNGQDTEGLTYNTTHFSYTIRDELEVLWSPIGWSILQTLYQDLYFPVCVGLLKQLMDQNKNLVTRRVRPRLRILSTQAKGQTLVTCLATDFYPRHINLTMFQDGHEVEEDRLVTRPVLPNGNSLYQLRKTLVLTDEELVWKHDYTCTTMHVSLDNRLQVRWRAKSYHSHRARLISPLIVGAVILLLTLVLVLVKCRRPQKAGDQRDLQQAEHVAMVTGSTETGASKGRPLEGTL
ncbi:hereditary hemochromatosis protein homolog [Synchiropus picturatus]